MTPPEAEHGELVLCVDCRVAVDASNDFCPRCGGPVRPIALQPAGEGPAETSPAAAEEQAMRAPRWTWLWPLPACGALGLNFLGLREVSRQPIGQYAWLFFLAGLALIAMWAWLLGGVPLPVRPRTPALDRSTVEPGPGLGAELSERWKWAGAPFQPLWRAVEPRVRRQPAACLAALAAVLLVAVAAGDSGPRRIAEPRLVLPVTVAALPAVPASNADGLPALATQRELNFGTLVGLDSLPGAMAVDGEGNLYVADVGRHMVHMIDPQGKIKWSVAPPASADPNFRPFGLAVGGDGLLTVLDPDQGKLYRFTGNGQYRDSLAIEGGLAGPGALALGPDGDFYVVESGQGRVLRVGPAGHVKAAYGKSGQLAQPSGAAIAANGDVFVADAAAGKIVRYASSGGAVAEWAFGTKDNLTEYGPDLALGADGSLWLSDTQANRLLRFSPDGRLLGTYGAQGLALPSGLVVTSGSVLVSEPLPGRVEQLALPTV